MEDNITEKYQRLYDDDILELKRQKGDGDVYDSEKPERDLPRKEGKGGRSDRKI